MPPPPPAPGATGPSEVCTKLFKATDFWRKHVEKRHPEFFQKIATEVDLVNAYVLDPAHIAPSRSDPNSNGHFPAGPGGQPIGTPRGFSLNNFQGGYPGMPGMMTGQPSMSIGMMAGMGMPGMPMAAMNGMPMGMSGVGPMRSHGGGRMNGFGGGGRMPGPYARNDGRGRMQSKYSHGHSSQQQRQQQHNRDVDRDERQTETTTEITQDEDTVEKRTPEPVEAAD